VRSKHYLKLATAIATVTAVGLMFTPAGAAARSLALTAARFTAPGLVTVATPSPGAVVATTPTSAPSPSLASAPSHASHGAGVATATNASSAPSTSNDVVVGPTELAPAGPAASPDLTTPPTLPPSPSDTPAPSSTPTPTAAPTPTPPPFTGDIELTVDLGPGSTRLNLTGADPNAPPMCVSDPADGVFTFVGDSRSPDDYQVAIQIYGYTGDGTYSVGAEVGPTRLMVTMIGSRLAAANQAAGSQLDPEVAALSQGTLTVSDQGTEITSWGEAIPGLAPPGAGYLDGTVHC
jgi:hypothetical protein